MFRSAIDGAISDGIRMVNELTTDTKTTVAARDRNDSKSGPGSAKKSSFGRGSKGGGHYSSERKCHFGSSYMAWTSAIRFFAVVAAFSNIRAYPRVLVAPSAAKPLSRIRVRAFDRRDFLGRSASVPPGTQPSLIARAVVPGAVLVAESGRQADTLKAAS